MRSSRCCLVIAIIICCWCCIRRRVSRRFDTGQLSMSIPRVLTSRCRSRSRRRVRRCGVVAVILLWLRRTRSALGWLIIHVLRSLGGISCSYRGGEKRATCRTILNRVRINTAWPRLRLRLWMLCVCMRGVSRLSLRRLCGRRCRASRGCVGRRKSGLAGRCSCVRRVRCGAQVSQNLGGTSSSVPVPAIIPIPGRILCCTIHVTLVHIGLACIRGHITCTLASRSGGGLLILLSLILRDRTCIGRRLVS